MNITEASRTIQEITIVFDPGEFAALEHNPDGADILWDQVRRAVKDENGGGK